mmetsp:Transcript_4670/g.5359  ORF Transcript_4670/g.5359 Transcript_4670/m.5359 type:complete len:357 (+) Transcript_4670:214-1284(+)
MTFIDAQTANPTPGQITIYCILVLGFGGLTAWAFIRAHTRAHYHRVYVIRFLFPIVLLFSIIENIFLAASQHFIRHANDNLSDHPALQIMFVLQAMIVPIYLLTIFELTYLIHKRRSVHFMGMYFDEGRLGRRVKGVFSTPFKSFIERNFIRMLSTILFVTGILANFNVLTELTTVGDLAGKTGWFAMIGKRDKPFPWDVFLSLIPALILSVCSFALSIILWRYGTNTSMIVHSSFLNPWFGPFFGTTALFLGQLVDGQWFASASNAGQFIYSITLILLMRQIDRDIVSFEEFTDFLDQVAKKGDEINVHNVLPKLQENTGELVDGVDELTDVADVAEGSFHKSGRVVQEEVDEIV